MDLLTKYYEKILFGLSLFVLLAGAVFFLQRLNSDTLVSPLAPNDVLGKGKVDPEDPQYKPADLVVPKVPELKILEVKGNGMLSPLRYTKCQNPRCGMCIEYEPDECPFCGTAQPEIPPHPNPDDFDGDGIPNAVEIANGLNTNDPADARQDPMHTGFTNFERLVKYKKYINPQDREKVPPLAFLLRVYKVAPVYFPIMLRKTNTDAGDPDAPSATFRTFPQAWDPAIRSLRVPKDRNALIYRDQGTSKNINMVVGDKLRQKLKDYKGPDLTVKTINAGMEKEVEVIGSRGESVTKKVMVYTMVMVDDAGKTYVFTSDEMVDCGDWQISFIYLIDRNPQQPTAMGGYAGPMGGYAGPMGGAATGPTGGAATGPTGGATAGGPTVSRRNPMYTVVTGDNKKISLRSPRQMVMGATPGMMGPGMTGGTAMGGGMPGGTTTGGGTDGRPVIEDYVCVSYEEKDGVGVAKVSMMAPVNDPKTLLPIPMFEAASDLFELPMTGGDTGGMPMAGDGDPGTMPDAMPVRPVAIPRRPGIRPVRP